MFVHMFFTEFVKMMRASFIMGASGYIATAECRSEINWSPNCHMGDRFLLTLTLCHLYGACSFARVLWDESWLTVVILYVIGTLGQEHWAVRQKQ